MELTPETFEKAEFVERRRGGYDIDQVETFLEDTGTEFARMLVKFERAEAELARSTDQIAGLEAQVTDLRQKLALTTDRLMDAEQQLSEAPSADLQIGAPSGTADQQGGSEEDVANVAKALILAQEAADKAMREARAEARAIVEGANSRAERQLAEANAKVAALVNEASARADREYADRRVALTNEIAEMESRREELAENISMMEVRITGYRDDLRRAGQELISVAEDPAFLGASEDDEPTEAATAKPADDTGGKDADDADAASDDDVATDDADTDAELVDEVADEASDGPSSEGTGSATADGADDAASTTSSDVDEDESSDEVTVADEVDETDTELSKSAGDAEGANDSKKVPTQPKLAQGWFNADPEPAGSPEDPSADADDSDDSEEEEDLLDLRSPETDAGVKDADGEWAPGSWSAVEKTLSAERHSTDDSDPIEARASTTTNPRVGAGSDDLDSTQAMDRVELIRDRYLEELDQAVNTELDAEDEALAAFLEGTGDSKARRFGWRR